MFGEIFRQEVKSDIERLKKAEEGKTLWQKAETASAYEQFESAGPQMKNFLCGLAKTEHNIPTSEYNQTEYNQSEEAHSFLGYLGVFLDSVRKIVYPNFISSVGIQDGILMAIKTRSKLAYEFFSRSSSARPKYTYIRKILADGEVIFEQNRADSNKVCCN